MKFGGWAALAALTVAGCAAVPPQAQESAARPSAWRIAAVADVPAEPTQRAAAAAILAYFQDTMLGNSFAAREDALCLGVGPASGGPFRFQPLEDLEPALLARIARTRPNVRPVSECATTLKGAPYRIGATGEAARLLACLSSGEFTPGTVRLLCGFYNNAIDAEFVGYDVAFTADEVIVRRNGRGLSF
jgi:hypothetical protein